MNNSHLHSGYASQKMFSVSSVLDIAMHWSLLTMPDSFVENANIENVQEEGHSKKERERKVSVSCHKIYHEIGILTN